MKRLIVGADLLFQNKAKEQSILPHGCRHQFAIQRHQWVSLSNISIISSSGSTKNFFQFSFFFFSFLFISKGCWFFSVINGEITGKAEMGNHPLLKIPISPTPHSSELKFQCKPVTGFPTKLVIEG